MRAYNCSMKIGMLAWMTSLLGIGTASADFSLWTDSSRVLINTTTSGADVSADVADFPLLVRLTAADFAFSEARSDGADLRFADSAGAPLPFELERFDASAKVAEAWVLLPMVKGNCASQWFRMYWGNTSVTAASSGPSVFASAGGYAGVWHLDEDATGGGGAYKDASGAGNHGTGLALDSAARVDGAIGKATLFSPAAGPSISIPHNAGLHPAAALSVEAWIKSASQGPFRRFVNKPFTTAAPPWNEYGLEADAAGGKAVFSVTVNDTEGGVAATTVMANGAWYHVAGTFDGIAQRIYINGFLEAILPRSGAASDYGQPLSIGRYALDDFSKFDGTVDEVRVSRIARSADWIKLEYANQKTGQNLIGFRKFDVCQATFRTPPDTSIDEGASLQLTAATECGGDYFWSVVSGQAPSILDPETPTLHVRVPRVSRDTFIVYRFSATVGGLPRSGDIKVTVKEAIPDPDFTLASTAWSGSDTLTLKPVIANTQALAAAKAPALHYAWTLSGPGVDTVSGADYLALSHPAGGGALAIGLCLDDGGATLCKQATVTIPAPTTFVAPRAASGKGFSWGSGRRTDASGRVLPGHSTRAR